jgi:hypothetical protein
MGVVVIPRVIFRLTPLAARQAVAPCRGHLRWSTALRPGSLVNGIRLCLSISRCIDAASPPGSCGTLRAATESQSSAHPPRCLVRPFRDCPGSSGTGYSVPSRALGVRRTLPPLRGCGMRRRLPRPICTHLLCLGLSRGPRPSDCFAGYIVHPCTRCSQGSPVGFICRMQMTTTRPSQGLVSRAWFAPMGSASRSYQL